MNINVVFDNIPVPAPAIFQRDVIDVARMIESQFTDPITFTIHVGYGEINGTSMSSGALGNSLGPDENQYSYADIRGGVQADHPTGDDAAALASLPVSDPAPGNHEYMLGTVEAAALGLALPPSASVDTYIGLSKTAPFDFDRSDGIDNGKYDFEAVVFHEITEVMGRYLSAGSSFFPSTYDLLDLFHYAAAGTRTFSATHRGFFSIDGGVTDLADFNTNRNGDPGDWADPQDNPGLSHYAGNDAVNAFSDWGVENSISEVDLTAMDVLGYDRVADDIRGNVTTGHAFAASGGIDSGSIEACFDQDWFSCTLTAGETYVVREQGTGHGGGTLTDPFLRLYNGSGTRVAFDDDAEGSPNSSIVFTPTASGTYYIAAGAHKDGFDNGTYYLGTYTVILDDFGDDASAATPMAIPSVTHASINYSGDRDWFEIHLIAGFTYDLAARGARPADSSNGTLADPYLRLYDATAATIPISQNDNEAGGPTGDNDAAIQYTPTASGTYFLEAAARDDAFTGTYTLVTSAHDEPPDLLTLSNADVQENKPAGTAIGTLSAHDPDPGDTLSLSLVGNPGGHFAIAGSQLTVAVPLDFETAASYQVTVRATDLFGKTLDRTFAIAVDNVSPEIINGTPGNDRLVGGRDRDFITGGHGKDWMTGHRAADRFIFKTLADSWPDARHDVITDFDQGSGHYIHAESDRIDLTRLEAVYHAHFGFAAEAITHAGPRNHLGFDSAHSLLQLDLNGDGKVDFAVALANLHHFVRADLLL